ncbi:TetR/AcrR family transcriptional regulator [Frankia sp. AgB32]|uniref:TetR/AcrR family transcriptional regulator n=1 Tax=Frankia sp. AgB32 TaxID=631119 RepID=UPI00200EABDF|nr:TetR/AcrR family transcriptional regulator [Frankia sp. AgB32]MCK9898202.1 TetR/AcrR family transcriptional regulator [Frankia sp. AgB32]
MTTSRAVASARRSVGEAPPAELRSRLLAALEELLAHRRFDALGVIDIIRAAGVSKASFYFYFASKQAVLAELVRQAVQRGHEAARPWVDDDAAPQLDPVAGLRLGVADGARLWRENAGVLRAIVESWGSDDELRTLWLDQMNSFTEATVTRIEADPAALTHLAGADLRATAAGLTWLGERLYYLAAAGVAPFDDQTVLIDTLLNAWTTTLYGRTAADVARPKD